MSYKLWVMNVNRLNLYMQIYYAYHNCVCLYGISFPDDTSVPALPTYSPPPLREPTNSPRWTDVLFNVPHAVFQIVNTIETHFRVRIDHTFRNIRIDPFSQMFIWFHSQHRGLINQSNDTKRQSIHPAMPYNNDRLSARFITMRNVQTAATSWEALPGATWEQTKPHPPTHA